MGGVQSGIFRIETIIKVSNLKQCFSLFSCVLFRSKHVCVSADHQITTKETNGRERKAGGAFTLSVSGGLLFDNACMFDCAGICV